MCTQMLLHATAHGGCTDTLQESLHVTESALKVDSERKIPCCTEESNLHQQCDGTMLYQLSYIPTLLQTKMPDSLTLSLGSMPSVQSYLFFHAWENVLLHRKLKSWFTLLCLGGAPGKKKNHSITYQYKNLNISVKRHLTISIKISISVSSVISLSVSKSQYQCQAPPHHLLSVSKSQYQCQASPHYQSSVPSITSLSVSKSQYQYQASPHYQYKNLNISIKRHLSV